MEREARVFRSFAASEKADREYYRSLTPGQRLEILFQLMEQGQGDESSKGFERVYRITKLHED